MFENVTITIKEILESYSHNELIEAKYPWDSPSIDYIVSNGKERFFDFSFPWYADDKTGLNEFEELFLKKYYMRQIGTETVALFKLYLQSRLMEKMPLYKQLYESTLFEYDPLINRKITTVRDGTEDTDRKKENETTNKVSGENTSESTAEGESSGTDNNETNNQSVHSENPEVTIANNDYASSMDREKKTYEGTTSSTGSETKNISSRGTADENNTFNESENENKIKNENETIEGFYGDSQADAVLKYRETILNLNEMLCNEMKGLFLGYYGGNYNGLVW